MYQPYFVFIILLLTLVFFIREIWRYDVVSLLALISSVLVGIVPYSNVFDGLSNPAVVTVACVMIITKAITKSGVVEYISQKLTPVTKNTTLHVGALTSLSTFLSAWMNDIAALSLVMPIAIQTSIQSKRPQSLILLPIAFGAILGGLLTAIGTPPNLLISAYRQHVSGQQFALFDFFYVGICITIVGVIYISIFGWRLLPRKEFNNEDDSDADNHYLTEIKVTPKSLIIGKTIQEIEQMPEDEFNIIELIRDRRKQLTINVDEPILPDDVLIVKARPAVIQKLLRKTKMILAGDEKISAQKLRASDVTVIEGEIPTTSELLGKSAKDLRLRERYHFNLLAISRQGHYFQERLSLIKFEVGDVLLLQGDAKILRDNFHHLGLVPLVEGGIKLVRLHKAFLSVSIFIGAILLAAFKVVPLQIAFLFAVVLLLLCKIISPRKVYQSVSWPVIVLLSSLIPVANALETTGGANLIANSLMSISANYSPIFILSMVLIITIMLSGVLNNAATALIMAPIAVTVAKDLHVHTDPFLMAIVVGASCAFLTPIAHQNNAVVMAPGGYRFLDYVRFGFPLEVITVVVGIPAILWWWPL